MHDDFWPAVEKGQFLRPRWEQIAAVIDDTRDGPDRAAAWHEARDRWIGHAIKTLNASRTPTPMNLPYCLGCSEHFRIIAPYKQDTADDVASLGEKFRVIARQILGEAITSDPFVGHVVLIIDDRKVAQQYLDYFGVNAGAISGLCIHAPFPHIMMHNFTRFHLRLVFVHELNHAVLHKLPIPTWIHEGLSRHFESRLLTIANMRFANEVDVGRNRLWREIGIADFWNGSVFYDTRASTAYLLATKMITRLLKRDAALFTQFMLKANRRDAGDAACREIYGHPILDLARELLGPGDWEAPKIREDKVTAT